MDCPMLISDSLAINGASSFSAELNVYYWTRLKVAEIMSREIVTIAPESSITEAAQIMSGKRISCVLVTTDNQLTGIITQKDMMMCARKGNNSKAVFVSDKMSQPVMVVSPDTPVLYAGRMMEENGIKRLPVVSERGVEGIITQTDLVRAFESLSALRSITEIMTTDIASVSPGQTVSMAVETMTEKGISSLLVTHNGKPEGILTEKDVLSSVLAKGKDADKTYVVDVMSFPLIVIPPSHSVLSASRLMYDQHLHRIVVADDDGIYGIVTRTDILKGYQTHAQREIQQDLHLLTHSKDAIILLDKEGLTTYVNPAFLQLFGVASPLAFIDQPFPPETYKIDSPEETCLVSEPGLEASGIQQFLLHKGKGDYMSIGLCLTDIKDIAGKVIGKQGVVWDLTKDCV